MPCSHCPHCQSIEQSNSVNAATTKTIELLKNVKDGRTRPNAGLQHLNCVRSATRNLPTEVLSHIFLHTAPPVDITSRTLRLYRKEDYPDEGESFTPILLQVVCSQWHHAAQSTPELWTSLILHVTKVKRIQLSISILEMYLANATNHAFSLELNLDKQNLPINATNKLLGGNLSGVYDPEGFALLEPFYSMIFEKPDYSRRIKVLRLSEVPLAWWTLPFGNFSQLEELQLGSECKHNDYKPTPRVFANLELTPLKRLLVKDTWLLRAPEMIGQIRSVNVLNLFRATIDDCFQSLHLFPNLIEFRARECYYHSDSRENISLRDLDLSKDFTLPELEILEWCFGDDHLSWALLEHAHLPALRTLGYGGSISGVEQTVLAAFSLRLPSSLLELELVMVEGQELWGLDECWEPLLDVQRLTLVQCSLECTKNAFVLLHNSECLPCLREVVLDRPSPANSSDKGGHGEYEADDRELNRSVRSQILFTLKERAVDSMNNNALFRFNTLVRNLDWEPSDGEKVQAIVEAGMDLQLLEDGQLLKGLYEDGNFYKINKSPPRKLELGPRDDSQDEDYDYDSPSTDDEDESDGGSQIYHER
ncbi:hypothetical protein NP233_g7706 [Leucocoprinus birnbaumii]|uniref:F-box domain-containing protein n=1 Tax=Leucocoprinus birnbaumii TaxID=56174 RepID=A0AAD5YUD2_9AGAR|nr:hypothetical protein NP233_g7706 [Leucocoprinus birnbaumii]